jgi:hypothetical protein
MSDTAASLTPTTSRNNGRFAKGGPGGPGRPRGSANRGDPVMSRAVVLTMLKLGGLERRVALLEGELKRRERSAEPRRRLIDGFRRLFSGPRTRKSQHSKTSVVSGGVHTDYKP